ncbi:hypothetical protein MPTK1_8g10070 [Marchantia polymorpha subsp. ruderalis]|uniref:Secreted protein n=1 Tax=Marchantia polymorpha TaxID=3197 RepID=A0A2R6XMW4_MARPO|nr:hypothetical protein MARPO_0008s0215 [Marchantia polymorpha]BBN19368.1 hypothetical protein Mp_8g10070 [Marchantia polymorpha subsp. ruderalis]|eukprot:PTQ47465.1 hypothetical protein MARPO_0008s0215 [Marchantia polymorpha]
MLISIRIFCFKLLLYHFCSSSGSRSSPWPIFDVTFIRVLSAACAKSLMQSRNFTSRDETFHCRTIKSSPSVNPSKCIARKDCNIREIFLS